MNPIKVSGYMVTVQLSAGQCKLIAKGLRVAAESTEIGSCREHTDEGYEAMNAEVTSMATTGQLFESLWLLGESHMYIDWSAQEKFQKEIAEHPVWPTDQA